MSPFRDRPFLRLALIGALVASLGLAACGRKGPLDPPPGASLAGEQANTPNPSINPMASPIGGQAKDDLYEVFCVQGSVVTRAARR